MKKPLFLLTVLTLLNMGCNNSLDSTKVEGASSGGGGFSDTYATETLSLAKSSLAQIIDNTSEKIFENLPKGKRKKWLSNIIRNIKTRPVLENRYKRPLKFNYDLKTETVYATNHFIKTFPYGRFYTRPEREKMRILIEVYLDILHEVSHFYGIGLTEDSDVNSELWAMHVIRHGLDELYGCIRTPQPNDETKYQSNGFLLHSPSGMITLLQESSEIDDYTKSSSFLFPFITIRSLELEKSNFWQNVFESHVSLALKNPDSILKKSLYARYIEEENNSELSIFLGNLLNIKHNKSQEDEFSWYAALLGVKEVDGILSWKHEESVGLLGENNEPITKKIPYHFEINKKTKTASYSALHPNGEKKKSMNFSCIHHTPTINIKEYQGKTSKLNLL